MILSESAEKHVAGRRLAMACVVSLLLHLLLALRFVMQTGGGPSPTSVLQARLVGAGPQVTIGDGVENRRSSAMEAAPDGVSEKPVAKLSGSTKQTLAKQRKPVPDNSPNNVESGRVVPVETAVAERQVAVPGYQTAGLPLPVNSLLVKKAVIQFDILSGRGQGRLIGRAEHRFVSDGQQNFGISIGRETNAENAAADFWAIEISGQVTPRGLSPVLYEASGALARRLLGGRAGSVPVASESRRKWRTPDGLLDPQSLLYYFMARPEAIVSGSVWLANPEGHAVFDYRVSGWESLTLGALGTVKTTRILFSSEQRQERIELWIANGLQNLPVRVRFTDPQGEITEQTATSLTFD